jgi:cell division protein FtsW (lipid II flippase)
MNRGGLAGSAFELDHPTLVALLLVAGYVRRRSFWLLVPVALALVLAVPIARERLVPGPSARGDITTGRAELWTTLWDDHIAPALPAGNGFGYTWSLTPEKLFGFRGFVGADASAEQFVYPHNDFLFWMIEFGLWGLALWLIYWVHLIASTRWLLKSGTARHRGAALIVLGIFVTMFIAGLVDNPLAIQPLAERFFVSAGFVLGDRAAASLSAKYAAHVR